MIKQYKLFSILIMLLIPFYGLANQIACEIRKKEFTLINWNAWEMGQKNNYPFLQVREQLLSYKPDIVALQEVKRCGSGFYHLLRPNIDFDIQKMWCAENKAYPGRGEGSAGSYGIGLASKFKTLSDKIIREIHGRTVLGAKYLINDKPVWIWSAHTAFVTSPTDTTRLSDFETIAELINHHVSDSAPVILVGDFNADRDNPWGNTDPERGEMQVFFDQGFIDLWREKYPNIDDRPGHTYYDKSRIDYILARDLPLDWHIKKLKVLDNIWCDIGMDNQGRTIGCGTDTRVDHSPILIKIATEI